MSEIHLLHGFMGFGKTTLAKKLSKELPAIRFTPDEIMLSLFGRTPENFQDRYILVDEDIKKRTQIEINKGNNVILDYGFWSKKMRQEYYDWAKSITDKVYFHSIICDIEIAKQRILERTNTNKNELYIDEICFNARLAQFEPISQEEHYPTIFYNENNLILSTKFI